MPANRRLDRARESRQSGSGNEKNLTRVRALHFRAWRKSAHINISGVRRMRARDEPRFSWNRRPISDLPSCRGRGHRNGRRSWRCRRNTVRRWRGKRFRCRGWRGKLRLIRIFHCSTVTEAVATRIRLPRVSTLLAGSQGKHKSRREYDQRRWFHCSL